MAPPTLTCQEALDFIARYVAGELPAGERRAFDAHLAVCAACVAYLNNYQAVIRLARAAHCGADEPVPPEVPGELVAAVLASRRATS